MEKNALIAVTDLHKTFGKNKVLQGVNFAVQKGENLVILGRSGSGKLVSIKCVVGLISADKGETKIFGTDIAKLSYSQLNEIRLRIGFLFQGGALYASMSGRKKTIDNAEIITKELSEFRYKINNGKGVLSKVLTGEAFVKSINQTVTNIKTSSNELIVFTQKLNDKNNTFSQLMNDPFYTNSIKNYTFGF